MKEDRFLKCIVDGNRRKILRSMEKGELCVNEIIGATELEQTLVSFHLKALRGCGLVSKRRDGKRIVYNVSHPEILETLKDIAALSSRIDGPGVSDDCE